MILSEYQNLERGYWVVYKREDGVLEPRFRCLDTWNELNEDRIVSRTLFPSAEKAQEYITEFWYTWARLGLK